MALPGQTTGIVGDLPADPLVRMTHGTAHRIYRFPGNKAFEPGDFQAGLFIGQPKPCKSEAQDPVPFNEENGVLFSLMGQSYTPIGDMPEQA